MELSELLLLYLDLAIYQSKNMKKKVIKPKWAPENSSDEFASQVLMGNSTLLKKTESKNSIKSKTINIDELYDGIINDNRTILAKAITLIESNSPQHIDKAQNLLKRILPLSGNSIRIGITGSPGVGKSTLIESLGNYLCELGYKVAVLAIDPSSSRSKGSILGDKTRMETLSRQKNAFIRPSASGGTLGGVASKTREAMLVCEASGFNIILIETVGVGQSEITVRSMVDFYMLMILPEGGDELQGIKKGVVELADLLIINKADGTNLNKAKITQKAYSDALHYILPATEKWSSKSILCSAINQEGIVEIWDTIQEFETFSRKSGILQKRRNRQLLKWVYSLIEEKILNDFYQNENIKKLKPEIEQSVLEGTMTPTLAVNKLLSLINKT